MRIALVSTCALSTPPKKYGGTELVVAELAKGLTTLGHEVTLYATGDSRSACALRYHFSGPIWPPNDLVEMRHAAFAWIDIANDRSGFDVVHLHHAAALPYQALVRRPAVLTVHHMRVDELVEHYREFPDVAYVAISRRQEELSPEVPFARTIHHGLDPALYPYGEGAGGYAAFLGRFAPEKAPHLAIDAARAAGLPLVLGGGPHEVPVSREYFEREMRPRLAQGRDVEWCGELGHGSKVKLLSDARALLFPLDWEEPFGLVMIEAMLVGTPVIAFARGSAPEVIDDGLTGFLVHDVREMAARLRQVDSIDRALCRKRAQARWSTDRMARQYVDLYETVLRWEDRAVRRCSRPVAADRGRPGTSAPDPGACAATGAEHGTRIQ